MSPSFNAVANEDKVAPDLLVPFIFHWYEGPPVAVNVTISPSQKYPSGADDVIVAVGGSFTETVIDSVLESVKHPFESIIWIVITSPSAMAFAPTVEEVNVLFP